MANQAGDDVVVAIKSKGVREYPNYDDLHQAVVVDFISLGEKDVHVTKDVGGKKVSMVEKKPRARYVFELESKRSD